MTDRPLIYEKRDAVGIVTINDPPWNRMTLAFMDELERLVADIAADDGIRAVVLTGAGDRNFSVGMDLKQLPEGIRIKGGRDRLFDQRLGVISAIETMGKPWIVTLFGYCLGGGLELPLGCHFRMAAEEGARIGLPEMDLGTVPSWGGSARLPRVIGRDRAIDMILRGKKISGREALRIGLVTEVWPMAELKARAVALAEELARQPRLAMRSMLACLVGMEEKSLGQAISEEREAVRENAGSPDALEGMTAFLEKRSPVFNRG